MRSTYVTWGSVTVCTVLLRLDHCFQCYIYQGNKSLGVVERSISVVPSTRASTMQLWYDSGGNKTEINGDITAVAGSLVTGISQ